MLISHLILSNFLGYFFLGFVAIFSGGDPAIAQNIKDGTIVLDKFNQQDVEYEDSKDLEGLIMVKKR